MKAADIVGRRIVGVDQAWHPRDRECGLPACIETLRIRLDDGSHLYFTVHERAAEYAVEAHVARKRHTFKGPTAFDECVTCGESLAEGNHRRLGPAPGRKSR